MSDVLIIIVGCLTILILLIALRIEHSISRIEVAVGELAGSRRQLKPEVAPAENDPEA
jgi:hypothetical protein